MYITQKTIYSFDPCREQEEIYAFRASLDKAECEYKEDYTTTTHNFIITNRLEAERSEL